jgi:Mn2+/Fe2+ NRAMP family transporter
VSDPYTTPAAAERPPPANWRARLKQLGPGVVIAGSIVGSGELILTSSLGAVAGFVLLWWMLMSCWSKSIVQAELGRYILASGDTYLRALNRIPGRLPGPGKPVSWTLWFSLLGFIPGLVGMGGIVGATGQALALAFPSIDSRSFTIVAAVTASAILYSGSYRRLEWTVLALVAAFTVATLGAAIAMQFTEFRVTASDLATGLAFELPVEHLVIALAVYGATGVNSAEISTYTYWCVEKGYPSFVGARRDDPGWPARARGWIRLLQTDVWITLVILTCATLPFYLLGAGVVHASGRQPQGLETVQVLSGMFTSTLGGWSLWLFGGAAFCVLYSSVVAGFGGISRFAPDFLIEFGCLDRDNLAARRRWIRACGTLLPLASAIAYLLMPSPVVLLTVGALMGAALLPLQSGATIWLQRHRMDPRVRHSPFVHVALWLTFLFQLAMAAAVLWFVIG